MPKRKLTRLQQKRKLEKSRRDERVRKLKKIPPLCVSMEFMDFAEFHEWDNETVDAAALLLHRYYLSAYRSKLQDGWLPVPFETLRAMFGKGYVQIKNKLIEDGFLEYDQDHGYKAGEFCSRFRPSKEIRESEITG